MSEKEEYKDDEVYPILYSAGGINAYSFFCDLVQQRRSYCVCASKVDANKRGNELRGLECADHVGRGHCPAIKMRQKEEEKGAAIFFINRTKFQEFHARKAGQTVKPLPPRAGVTLPKLTDLPRIPAPKRPTHVLDVQQGTYADAINAAIAEGAPNLTEQPRQPEQKPAIVVPTQAGMSLLEMARAHNAARA